MDGGSSINVEGATRHEGRSEAQGSHAAVNGEGEEDDGGAKESRAWDSASLPPRRIDAHHDG